MVKIKAYDKSFKKIIASTVQKLHVRLVIELRWHSVGVQSVNIFADYTEV